MKKKLSILIIILMLENFFIPISFAEDNNLQNDNIKIKEEDTIEENKKDYNLITNLETKKENNIEIENTEEKK